MTLPLGRPANRTRRLKGDRRGQVAEGRLLGHDAHGVFWRPVREYYQDDDTTLVVYEPVHPSELGL